MSVPLDTRQDIETKLLSVLTRAEAINDVTAAGLVAEHFLEPLPGAIFTWVLDYWKTHGVAPTAAAIEETWPPFKVVAVEEPPAWLANELRKRGHRNVLQDILLKGAKSLHDDPIGTQQWMAEQLAKLPTDDYVPPTDVALQEAVDKERIRLRAREEARRLEDAETSEVPRRWPALELAPAEQPRWLAKYRLPRAAMCLLLGDEGIGKSLLWMLLVAHITTGHPLAGFGIPRRDPGRAVLVLTEDNWSNFVRPRLEVAGADLSRIELICVERDGSGAPVFPRDITLLDAEPRPDIVVVDCWLDTLPAALRVASPQDARQALHPWKEVATRTDACVLLLAHTNRISSPDARSRYGGGYALRQKARMTLFAQSDEEGNLLVGPEKANAAPLCHASKFSITTKQFFAPNPEDDGTIPLLVYEGESDRTTSEILADSFAGDNKPDGQLWLRMFLNSFGPRWTDEIEKAAKEAGITEHGLKSAKKALGVVAKREGTAKRWYWALPGQEGQVPNETPKQSVEQGGEQGGDSPKITPLLPYEVRAGFTSPPYDSSPPYEQGGEPEGKGVTDNALTSQEGKGVISESKGATHHLTSDPQATASETTEPFDWQQRFNDLRARLGVPPIQQTSRADTNGESPHRLSGEVPRPPWSPDYPNPPEYEPPDGIGNDYDY